MHFGKNLQALREDRHLSLEELAQRAGLAKSHVRYLEHGEHAPGPATLRRLADALGIDQQELRDN